jgi:putative SOS response-associated peptidase YedK
LILADGFYEWQKRTRGKIPYRITLKTEQPFAFAGIYVLYDDMPTFSIITTEPNALMAKIHDRMPVILHQSQEKMWLEGFLKNQDLSSYLRAYPANEMKAYPISPAVNSPKNDSIEVTYPLKSLFRQIRNK